MKKVVFALCLLICPSFLWAQQVYSLNELIAASEGNTPQNTIDSLSAVSARAEQLQARSALLPKANFNTAWFSLQSPIKVLDAHQTFTEFFNGYNKLIPHTALVDRFENKINDLATIDFKNTWVMNVSLVQPLFTGGKLYAANKMSDLGIKATELKATRKKAEQRFAIEEAYYNHVRLYEQGKILEEFIAMISNIASDVEALYNEGYATKADLLDARMAVTKAKRSLNELNAKKPIASHNLANLANLTSKTIVPSDSTETLLANVQPLLDKIASFQLYQQHATEQASTTTTSISYGARAELLSIQSELGKYKTLDAQSAMLPKLAFYAGYTAVYPNLFNARKKQLGGSWSLGLMLEVPITDIYSGWQARKSAHAKAQIAKWEEADNLSKLTLERENINAELQQAKIRFEANKQLMDETELTLDLAIKGYKEGEINIERVLRSESDWLQVKTDLLEALTTLYIQYAKLQLSIR